MIEYDVSRPFWFAIAYTVAMAYPVAALWIGKRNRNED